MPTLETVDDIVEALADWLGIYDQRLQFVGRTIAESRALEDWEDHADDCGCRMCWCGRMEARIRAAVTNETRLAALTKEG